MNLFHRFGAIALAGIAVAWSGPSASQVPILEFDDQLGQTAGGTISYDGNAGSPLIGTNITFDNILGTNTPANAGVPLACNGCRLNFQSGPNVQNGAVGGQDWVFGTGGTFELTGSVPAVGIGNDDILIGELVVGDFKATSLGPVGIDGRFTGVGLDIKNPDLLAFYGLDSSLFVFVNSEISVGDCSVTGNAFNCNVQNADIVNAEIPVPEPASLALLGLGLAGIGAARCRARRS